MTLVQKTLPETQGVEIELALRLPKARTRIQGGRKISKTQLCSPGLRVHAGEEDSCGERLGIRLRDGWLTVAIGRGEQMEEMEILGIS